jgi:signal transduction histidine kinase
MDRAPCILPPDYGALVAGLPPEEAAERLGALLVVTDAGLADLDLDALLTALLERVCGVTRADTAAILLRADDDAGFCVRASLGLDEQLQGDVVTPMAAGLPGPDAGELQPVIRNDISLETASPALRQLHSMMLAPMVVDGATTGVLQVGSRSPRHFRPDELTLLSMVANRCALAIDRARALAELREARIMAEAASQAKSNFLSVMSHELRTPLNSVIGYGELLRDGTFGQLSEAQATAVGRLLDGAWLLAGQVNTVLTFSRLEAGREEVQHQVFSAAQLAEETVALLRPMAGARGLTLNFEPAAAGLKMLSDAAKVRQILLNLLSNAIKYTDEGGVTVTCSAAGQHVVFAVADTGMGIADEDRQRIWEPFTQLDQSDTRAHGGTGLGLTVALRLAELLDGRIDLDSTPGEGTTFSLVLPRYPAVSGD